MSPPFFPIDCRKAGYCRTVVNSQIHYQNPPPLLPSSPSLAEKQLQLFAVVTLDRLEPVLDFSVDDAWPFQVSGVICLPTVTPTDAFMTLERHLELRSRNIVQEVLSDDESAII